MEINAGHPTVSSTRTVMFSVKRTGLYQMIYTVFQTLVPLQDYQGPPCGHPSEDLLQGGLCPPSVWPVGDSQKVKTDLHTSLFSLPLSVLPDWLELLEPFSVLVSCCWCSGSSSRAFLRLMAANSILATGMAADCPSLHREEPQSPHHPLNTGCCDRFKQTQNIWHTGRDVQEANKFNGWLPASRVDRRTNCSEQDNDPFGSNTDL